MKPQVNQINGNNGSKKKRNFLKSWSLTYHQLKRTGFFKYVGKPLLKLLIIFIVIVVLLYLLGNSLFDIDAFFDMMVTYVPFGWVMVIFFILEAALPILPVDLFIFWTNSLENPWLCLTVLALISYFASLTAYAIGRMIRKIPSVNTYFLLRFDRYVKNSKKWGGYLIAAAALTPLPYTFVVISMGLIRYPFPLLAFWATMRILHFYLYALVIYGII